MKFFIGILLQSQVCSLLGVGLKVLTGLSILWCVPIAFVLVVMYDAGGMILWGEE
jgi:hypothetical protein